MKSERLPPDFVEKFREAMRQRTIALPFPPPFWQIPDTEPDPCDEPDVSPCQETTLQELCEEFVEWGQEVSCFLARVYSDLYDDPATVDPPPPPPFKRGG